MTRRHAMVLALLLASTLAGARCATGHVAGRTADAVTGQIRGRVFDEYGASIPDASVVFQPVDPKAGLAEFRVAADARGRFDFEGVRTGTYRVTCRALGYETTVAIEEVRPGVLTEVTLVMRPARSRTLRALVAFPRSCNP